MYKAFVRQLLYYGDIKHKLGIGLESLHMYTDIYCHHHELFFN